MVNVIHVIETLQRKYGLESLKGYPLLIECFVSVFNQWTALGCVDERAVDSWQFKCIGEILEWISLGKKGGEDSLAILLEDAVDCLGIVLEDGSERDVAKTFVAVMDSVSEGNEIHARILSGIPSTPENVKSAELKRRKTFLSSFCVDSTEEGIANIHVSSSVEEFEDVKSPTIMAKSPFKEGPLLEMEDTNNNKKKQINVIFGSNCIPGENSCEVNSLEANEMKSIQFKTKQNIPNEEGFIKVVKKKRKKVVIL